MYKIEGIKYCDPDTIGEVKPRDLLVNDSLSLNVYENVIILPPNNCIINDFDGELIQINEEPKSAFILDGINSNIIYPIIVNEIDLSNLDVEQENNNILYLGAIPACWGHFFTDGFSKMWWLLDEQNITFLKTNNIKIKYVSPYGRNEDKYIPWFNLIKCLGLDLDITPINDYRLYKRVYVPDNSLHMMNNHRVFNKEYSLTINRVLTQIKPKYNKKYEKLYLSRKRWIHVNADFGERAIERLFNKVGYTSICPELYSVGEQLAIYQSAKSIVATSGSIAHNAVFCNKGTELIILRKGVGTFDYQEVVNQVNELNVIYIDCHLTLFVDENVNLGPFFIYINDNVIRFFKDRYNLIVQNNFDVNHYLEYTRLCFAKDNFYKRNQSYNGYSDYYFKKLTSEIRNKRSIYRRIYDGLANLGLSKLKNKLKKIYCYFKR